MLRADADGANELTAPLVYEQTAFEIAASIAVAIVGVVAQTAEREAGCDTCPDAETSATEPTMKSAMVSAVKTPEPRTSISGRSCCQA